MIKPDFPPELIEAFHKSFAMFESFAKDNGVLVMGTVAMLKRLEDSKFGATQVNTFTYNHPNQDPK